MIEIKDFEKGYDKPLFTSSSITFASGSINFVMGKNGSGKTTLFKCISGLEDYKGTITYDGRDINGAREELFVVWDDAPFYSKLSGIANLLLFSENRKNRAEIMKIADSYLSRSILKRRVSTYSYGQKKRLALVLLEILAPKYILMDEISNGLDVETMDLLQRRLVDLKQYATIILTGHQFSFYQSIADRVFVKKEDGIVEVEFDKNTPNILEKIYHEETDKS